MILGLTGGIASGKTTVSKKIKELGGYIIDADKISKEVSNSQEVLKKVEENFGVEVIENGSLNRKKLREIIFNNREKRKMLNNIMHPIIVKKMKEEIEEHKEEKLIVLDIPLLYETKLEYLCDKVLVVWVDENTQIERIKKRDNSSTELAKRILRSQMPLLEKLKKADYNIENNETIEKLEKKVEKFIETLDIL
ncbi:MAG: dephospho-CoA kinase [Fusobacteria bacterium]|nr:MAG: dephospho-CoA kinase [Fusobacteriota bacterium]